MTGCHLAHFTYSDGSAVRPAKQACVPPGHEYTQLGVTWDLFTTFVSGTVLCIHWDVEPGVCETVNP